MQDFKHLAPLDIATFDCGMKARNWSLGLSQRPLGVPRTARICVDAAEQRAGASGYCRGPCLGAPTALQKPGGRVRGIATGDVFRRVVSRALGKGWADLTYNYGLIALRDARLKENIREADLEELQAIFDKAVPKCYDRTDVPHKSWLGFVAQDFEGAGVRVCKKLQARVDALEKPKTKKRRTGS